MDLWQMVIADQANIDELCREILRATDDAPVSRSHLFAELGIEMERHLRAKENVLYPALAPEGRMGTYVSELERENDEIRRGLRRLSSGRRRGGRDWANGFKELSGKIRHAFSQERHGLLTVARGAIPPEEERKLQRDYERMKIASLEARGWHLPEAMMPSRYGLSTGAVFGVLASAAALGAAALLWRSTGGGQEQRRSMRPMRRSPSARSSWRDHFEDRVRGHMAPSTAQGQGSRADMGDEALLHGAGSGEGARGNEEQWFSSANPPHAPSGLATPLQPGGVAPGGGPGASMGSIGTGGGQTENRDTGSVKREGR